MYSHMVEQSASAGITRNMAAVASGLTRAWEIFSKDASKSSIDFKAISEEGAHMTAIPEDVKRRFDSLVTTMTPTLKIRYLLLHAYWQRECIPSSVYENWLTLLSEHGIPRRTVDIVLRGHGSLPTYEPTKAPFISDAPEFSEDHVSVLTEVLADISHKWQEIASSEPVNLPENVKSDIYITMIVSRNSRICMNLVLREWIVGRHKGAKPPTLENLKRSLRSHMVGLGRKANQLQESLSNFQLSPSSLHAPVSDASTFEIIYQSLSTEQVGKKQSTLLEVQIIAPRECEISYEWTKDDCPLKEDEHHLGTNKSILCISNATTLATEGMYICTIKAVTNSGGTSVKKSKGTQVTMQVTPAQSDLVGFYSVDPEMQKDYDAWPPESCKSFVNLALVKQEKMDKKSDFYTLQGDLDDIVNKKENIEYDEAFGKFKSGFFLIEGRPGSGKTTLLHKITKDWASHKFILKGAEYVFLVPLRVLPKEDLKMDDIFILKLKSGTAY